MCWYDCGGGGCGEDDVEDVADAGAVKECDGALRVVVLGWVETVIIMGGDGGKA